MILFEYKYYTQDAHNYDSPTNFFMCLYFLEKYPSLKFTVHVGLVCGTYSFKKSTCVPIFTRVLIYVLETNWYIHLLIVFLGTLDQGIHAETGGFKIRTQDLAILKFDVTTRFAIRKNGIIHVFRFIVSRKLN